MPSPTPRVTPDLYAPLTIDALTARSYGGGQLEIVDTLERNEQFTRYLITYPSDGLTVYGYMNVPNEGSQFPVVLMLHGYIPPAEYQTVAYTQRYADALAEAGYFVIHPNFRNYPPSDEGPNPYRIGYAIDVLNLIAIIREQSQDETGYLRRADADNIHLWGHSMGGGVALRVLAVNNAPYLKAAVLYAAMSGDEDKNNQRILAWTNGRRGQFELAASSEQIDAISPINYLDRINAAISVHHSRDDAVVPVEWSEELCAELAEIDHPYECFFYDGLPHTFNGGGDALFMERVVQFFRKY
ncbi:MAG: alpha/beta fold hydrolase [Chloroflexi bacterium]|nr:alpha/beta fold hydrolase [Chloroflexota bacterium]